MWKFFQIGVLLGILCVPSLAYSVPTGESDDEDGGGGGVKPLRLPQKERVPGIYTVGWWAQEVAKVKVPATLPDSAPESLVSLWRKSVQEKEGALRVLAEWRQAEGEAAQREAAGKIGEAFDKLKEAVKQCEDALSGWRKGEQD